VDDRRLLTRVAIVWAILSVIAVLAVIFLLGPHMPPGRFSANAADQTRVNIILSAIMAPIVMLVWVFFGYSLINFRQRGEQIEDGAPIRGNARIQVGWVTVTTTIVICLAALGTYELVATGSTASGAGAAGGQGPTPISAPAGNPLRVQVIAQQWQFTYRFPQYGGVETFDLKLPVNRTIQFNVTSLDVIHSFWAYQLGVKADAVPGANNVAFARTTKTGGFKIRCAELCGLWHGYMYARGDVVSQAQFASWIQGQRVLNAPATHYLTPYRHVYYPQPYGRAG
jgi:cytochrome c oxidase subunit II